MVLLLVVAVAIGFPNDLRRAFGAQEDEKIFIIFDQRTVPTPGSLGISMSIVLCKVVSKHDLRLILQSVHQANLANLPSEFGTKPDRGQLYAFAGPSEAMAGAGLWLAMLSFRKDQTRVLFHDSYIAAWSSPPEERLGLSDARRKEIYRAIGQVEMNALEAALAVSFQ